MKDFVFYDLETTGISPAYDQPLQFAAIRTDADLVEIERVEFKCRLAPHILPAPQALVVTGVTPIEITNSNLPNLFELSQRLQELISRWAPATWIGYNTLKFDEPMLRQTFYQNLQPQIYATQTNGNDRLDLLQFVQTVFVKDKSLLRWPINDKNKVSFKLDMLAPENGFSSHNAHDALGDVEATIFLSKKIIDGNRKLWEQLLETRNKHYVRELFETFKPIEIVLRFGGAEPKSYFGCFCGVSKGNQNSYGFFDLEVGRGPEYMLASDQDLKEAVETSPKKIRSISINNAPPVIPVDDPSPDWLAICNALRNDNKFQQRTAQALASRFEERVGEEKPVEEQIYGGFYSNKDQKLLHQFQIEDWPARAELISQFEDPRLKQLGRRLIAFHAPGAFAQSDRERLKTFLHNKWFSDETKVPWTTFDEVRAQLDEIIEGGKIEQKIKDDLIGYYNDKMREFD